MKYTILFLAYDPEHKVCDIMKESLHSIVTNSYGHDYEIIILDRKGLQKEVNRGFRQARGEYIILMGDDVVIQNNWLDLIARPDTITSFLATKSQYGDEEVDFSCVCFPKNVREKVGFFDEDFANGYGYDDNDYLRRAKALGIPLAQVPVKVRHLGGETFKAYQMANNINKDIFEKKYGLGIYAK